MGSTKPGAPTSDIIKTVDDEIATFSNKEFVILWTGANDISKNNTKVKLRRWPMRGKLEIQKTMLELPGI
jgi:hypothetical protein